MIEAAKALATTIQEAENPLAPLDAYHKDKAGDNPGEAGADAGAES